MHIRCRVAICLTQLLYRCIAVGLGIYQLIHHLGSVRCFKAECGQIVSHHVGCLTEICTGCSCQIYHSINGLKAVCSIPPGKGHILEAFSYLRSCEFCGGTEFLGLGGHLIQCVPGCSGDRFHLGHGSLKIRACLDHILTKFLYSLQALLDRRACKVCNDPLEDSESVPGLLCSRFKVLCPGLHILKLGFICTKSLFSLCSCRFEVVVFYPCPVCFS